MAWEKNLSHSITVTLLVSFLSQESHRNELTFRRGTAAATNLNSGHSGDDFGSGAPPSFLQESPFDNKVARGVKRAYGTIDQLSCRFGVALRRNPLVRVGVVAYMVRKNCQYNDIKGPAEAFLTRKVQ